MVVIGEKIAVKKKWKRLGEERIEKERKEVGGVDVKEETDMIVVIDEKVVEKNERDSEKRENGHFF